MIDEDESREMPALANDGQTTPKRLEDVESYYVGQPEVDNLEELLQELDEGIREIEKRRKELIADGWHPESVMGRHLARSAELARWNRAAIAHNHGIGPDPGECP